MASPSESSKAIGLAARAILRPLGLVQKGRSRTWLDDHGWWVGNVEFQPSGFAKGSYLNVGACWLWWPSFKDYLSFDVGSRVAPFEPYDDESFARTAEVLARRAASEVAALSARFVALDDAVGHLRSELTREPRDPWTAWDLSMALALSGRQDEARRIASRPRPSPEVKWERSLGDELDRVAILDDDAMLAAVLQNIAAARAALHLESWEP